MSILAILFIFQLQMILEGTSFNILKGCGSQHRAATVLREDRIRSVILDIGNRPVQDETNGIWNHVGTFNGKSPYSMEKLTIIGNFLVINVGIAMSLAPPLLLMVGFHHP